MAKVVVTGVAGFLGSHLAERLLGMGHAVVGVDNLLSGESEHIPEGVKWYGLDARDVDHLGPVFEGADVVYHLAAAPHEGLSVFSPGLVTEHTFTSTVAVARMVVQHRVRRLVFCSSIARYGDQDIPFTEDLPTAPRDPYGVAKVASEQLIRCLSEAHGFEYAVAVPHNITGPRQRYTDPFRNVAAIMINLMLQGRQPFIYGDGEQRRAFSFVDDVVDPLLRMGFAAEAAGETINVGPDEEFVSVNKLAGILAEIIGFRPLRPVYVGERPLEVRLCHASADKARRLLGYRTTVALRDGLQAMVAWIARQGPRPFEYYLPIELPSDRLPAPWRDRLF